MNNPKVSVIIPAYNEEKDISACLSSLKKQSLKNFEIIIVDDGSQDNTLDIIKKFKGVKIIEGEHKGPGFSRNLGAKIASGSILVFVDADMTFDEDYLKNLIDPIVKEKIVGTTHELETAENQENIWSKCWGKIRVSKENAEKVKIFRAINKNFFLVKGGFDPIYGYADDQTFWIKYKIKPAVAKNTICYHKNPEKIKDVYKQSVWIGSSIESKLLKNKIFFSALIPFLMIFSQLAVSILSLKKIKEIKSPKIIFFVFLFTLVRYFGTLKGIANKTFFNFNLR